ncbi:MAG TPA: hypothetical protein VJC13_01045 [Candidatus Paceibacterota bacterium]|nr:hypothetical protein [uncultured archaeon]
MSDILTKDLVKEWGLESLAPAKQADTVDRIAKMLYQAVLVRALDILSEKEQTELDLLLDEDGTTPHEVLNFLATRIPTFEQLLLDEKKSLKDDLLVPTV